MRHIFHLAFAALTFVSTILFAIGCVGCICRAFLFNAFIDGQTMTTRMQAPISNITGLGTDRSGNLYIGSGEYHQILVFTPSGKFLKAFYVGSISGYGDFRFRVTTEGALDVYGVRTHSLSHFTSDRLVGTEYSIDTPGWYYDASAHNDGCTVSDGLLQRTRIVCLSSNGIATAVVREPFMLWLLKFPVPSLLFVALGFPLAATALRRHNRKKEESIASNPAEQSS